MTIKPIHNQHYVPRLYLKAWANQGGQIYCLRHGQIIRPNITGVAQQRHFYKPVRLTDAEIEFIYKLLIAKSPPILQPQHIEYIRVHNLAFELDDLLDKAHAQYAADKKQSDAFIINFGEYIHSGFEDYLIKYLEGARASNLSTILAELETFLHVLFVQYLRTNRVKQAVIRASRDTAAQLGVDFERLWPAFVHILALNSAYSIHCDWNQYHLAVIQNRTAQPFITGDQPIVNMEMGDGMTPPTEIDIYYPVSPERALILVRRESPVAAYRDIHDPEIVDHLNRLICKASCEQLYANSEQSIEYSKRLLEKHPQPRIFA